MAVQTIHIFMGFLSVSLFHLGGQGRSRHTAHTEITLEFNWNLPKWKERGPEGDTSIHNGSDRLVTELTMKLYEMPNSYRDFFPLDYISGQKCHERGGSVGTKGGGGTLQQGGGCTRLGRDGY